jgi:hypothetical protein
MSQTAAGAAGALLAEVIDIERMIWPRGDREACPSGRPEPQAKDLSGARAAGLRNPEIGAATASGRGRG